MQNINSDSENSTIAYLLVMDRRANSINPWQPLVQLPEHCPGAQLIKVSPLSAYRQDDQEIPAGIYLVFNCEFFLPMPNAEEGLYPARYVPQASYPSFVNSHLVQYKTKLGAVTVLPPALIRSTLVTRARTTSAERFWRVSAYASDRRITLDRQLAPGTYVATNSDIEFIASGLGAVGRYALPNPFPSIYAFSVIPDQGTPIELGTVRPLYGQAGGGVEGVFQKSTGEWTVSNHVRVLPAW